MSQPTINISWLELKPNELENGNQEYFEDYYNRVQNKWGYSHVPEIVYKQWLWAHHKEPNTLNNYAWLDFRKIKFSSVEFTIAEIVNFKVIEEFQEYVDLRQSCNSFEEFCCTDEDLGYWKTNKTWKTPPVVINLESINSAIPKWCDLKGKYQLVEGHSRLGYFKSLINMKAKEENFLNEKHKVWLLELTKEFQDERLN